MSFMQLERTVIEQPAVAKLRYLLYKQCWLSLGKFKTILQDILIGDNIQGKKLMLIAFFL